MVHKPEILILSSQQDYSCDYVVKHLLSRGKTYLRLNSEDLPSYDVSLDPLKKELTCKVKGTVFLFTQDTLRSVWYRRPVYLRDHGPLVPVEAEAQIARSQWAAFLRGLIVFDAAKWVNHPGATYIAEQKPFQLSVAQTLGFQIPETVITNHAEKVSHCGHHEVAVKGVDTVIAYANQREIFAFTNIISAQEVAVEDLRECPVILQRAIRPKVDVRVTVVEDRIFSALIQKRGTGLHDDWRLDKTDISYVPISLPTGLDHLCQALTKALRLRFAAIDLLRSHDDYFFLEINPTGEWAWLVDAAGLRIDEAIADALSCS